MDEKEVVLKLDVGIAEMLSEMLKKLSPEKTGPELQLIHIIINLIDHQLNG